MKKIVFTFGRMNPPTIGHAKLVKKVNDVARSNGADARVYLSHTQNDKKDPLSYKDKIRFARKAFGDVVVQSQSKTVFQIMSEIEKGGYTDVIMVVGSDRVPEFKKILTKYNGKDYTFDSISVVSAGERDPDATGVEGMSASKLRAVAKEGDFDTFKQGLPKGLNDRDAKAIFDTINKVIKEDLDEDRAPLTLAQRNARARMMKRLAPKLARFKKMRAKRMADKEKLMKRAQIAAKNIIRKKVTGERGANYSALSASEKITIDKLVAKKSAVIAKLAKKLMPKVRKAEIARLKKARDPDADVNKEWIEFDFDTEFVALFEAEEKERKKEVAQDSDVKDVEGTQPKKYYKDLSKKDKEARAKHFAKGDEKPDGADSSYTPAPGDKGVETKPSKHTLKYKKMFGEGKASDLVRDKISREKEADAIKHQRMIDQAKSSDEAEKAQKQPKKEEFELSEDATVALQKKADKSGIPLGILRQVYNRGMAAWKTGHRPGATQQQWGFARVNSFITGGKTRTTADADLWAKAKGKKEEVEEAVSPAQQAAIAISKKERGEKPKKEEEFEPHMMYDPESGDKELAKVPADHDRLSKKGWTHTPPKKKLKAMLAVPSARPPSQIGEDVTDALPTWLAVPLSKVTNKKGYDAAKKILQDVLARKKKEQGKMGLRHDVNYYAGQIAKQFRGVDARTLAKMVSEEGGAGDFGTDKLKKKYKNDTPGQSVKGSHAFVFDATPMDLNPAMSSMRLKEAIEYHQENDLSIKENVFRPHSDSYYAFFRECRRLWEKGELEITDPFDKTLMESDAGLVAIYEGEEVPLDIPLIEEEDKELNKPKRGGPKKFYVYVKDGDKIKKVSFGDTTGLKAKIDDPEARKSFVARHKCDMQKDKTTAAYWSCRLPYYAKELGLEGGGSFFW